MTQLAHCDAFKDVDWDDLKNPLEVVTTFQDKPWAKISSIYSQNWPFGFFERFLTVCWWFLMPIDSSGPPLTRVQSQVMPEVFKFFKDLPQLKIQSLYSPK